MDKNLSIFGLAKHICGCALELSIQCLNNNLIINKESNTNINHNKTEVKGLCFATCCHQKSDIKCLPKQQLEFYMNYLGLTEFDIIMLFKATSWFFGPINKSGKDKDKETIGEGENEESQNFKESENKTDINEKDSTKVDKQDKLEKHEKTQKSSEQIIEGKI